MTGWRHAREGSERPQKGAEGCGVVDVGMCGVCACGGFYIRFWGCWAAGLLREGGSGRGTGLKLGDLIEDKWG